MSNMYEVPEHIQAAVRNGEGLIDILVSASKRAMALRPGHPVETYLGTMALTFDEKLPAEISPCLLALAIHRLAQQ